MNCEKCNASITNEDVYCNKCGKKLKPSRIENYVTSFMELNGVKMPINPFTLNLCKDFANEAFEKGNYYEAIEYYSFALSHFEISDLFDKSNLNNQLGISLGYTRDFNKALEYINKAISFNPSNFQLIENRVMAKLNLADDKGAVSDIEILLDNSKMRPHMWYYLGVANENLNFYDSAKLAYQRAIDEGYSNAKSDLLELQKKIASK